MFAVDSRKSKITIAVDKADGLTIVNGSFGLILYVTVNNFSVCLDGSSNQRIKCLALYTTQ